MATYLGEIQRKQMINRDIPHFINTQTLRFQHVTKAFQSKDVPSFVLPVIRNSKRLLTMFLKAICLEKNPRKQMTNRDVPHFSTNKQPPNPN
jgi:hypothetical protein